MSAAEGRIGPNALLQLAPLLERTGGTALRDRVFAVAGVAGLPRGDAMIDEAPVARVHQALRHLLPHLAPGLAREAGLRTADYILAHRIPMPAQWVLRHLPAPVAARLLAKAIARNAWTFAGSGSFRVVRASPMLFELADNPVVRGERAGAPVCQWHAAVFERLFAALADPGATVREVACCACGDAACRFEIRMPRRRSRGPVD